MDTKRHLAPDDSAGLFCSMGFSRAGAAGSRPASVLSALLSTLLAVGGGCSSSDDPLPAPNYSGTYCLNLQRLEMTIVQTGTAVTFSLQTDILRDGMGTAAGSTMSLTAVTAEGDTFTATITFSEDGTRFSGPYQLTNAADQVVMEGVLVGDRGECAEHDIEANGIPRFVGTDFTQVSKIEKISKFRSGFGHSYTDGVESCRSMKHYYDPYAQFRLNDTVEVYDLDECATSFDIAVWVNTPSGPRLVPYFDTLDDVAFEAYRARGALTRGVFGITRAERDADPLQCDGETFLTDGNLESWVTLN